MYIKKKFSYLLSVIAPFVLWLLQYYILDFFKQGAYIASYIKELFNAPGMRVFFIVLGIIWFSLLVILAFVYSVIIIKVCSREIIESRIKKMFLLSMWPALIFGPIPEVNRMMLPSIFCYGTVMFLTLRFLCKRRRKKD